MRWTTRRWAIAALAGTLIGGFGIAVSAGGAAPQRVFDFHLVRSGAAANAGCLRNASAAVKIVSKGPVETMRIKTFGLPANTDFDVFVIQVPNAPFGLSWYQGDLETNGKGTGDQTFVGRFSVETFIVAPGTAPAPVVHETDADANPATPPVHTFHVGLWFNSPVDAKKAGCPATVTPFNGDHTAGIQALSSRTFPDAQGPLRHIRP